MATVSVIIPAYDSEAFVAEAIRSALAQTVAPAEIIVVDDGSRDGTRSVAAAFGPAVRVLAQANGGAARARNAGAAAASGDWLAFLDADDRWLPTKLERQLARASDVALVYTNRLNVGDLDGLPRVHGDLQPGYEGDIFEPLLAIGNVITTSSVLVSRDAFAAVGGFDPDPALIPAEDWDLWLRVAERHRAAYCAEPLVEYRLHAGGISRSAGRMMRARTLVVDRALASPRGRTLPPATVRGIRATTHRTNGWEAGRAGQTGRAVAEYLRALSYRPADLAAVKGLARVLLGRG